MSPLIDVTNTAILNNVQLTPNTISLPRQSKNVEEPTSAEECQRRSQLTKESSSVTKCNTFNKSLLPRRKQFSFKIPSKHSCQGEILQLTMATSDLLLKFHVPKISCKQIPVLKNFRVPPLPTDELSHALESLNLNIETYEKHLVIDKSSQPQEETKFKNNSNLTGSLNNIGPPSVTLTSACQCIACGLEFSSIDNLTPHLVKHIYEGLHAATWLNTAMLALLPAPPNSPQGVDGSSTLGVNSSDANELSSSIPVSSHSTVASPKSNGDNMPLNIWKSNT